MYFRDGKLTRMLCAAFSHFLRKRLTLPAKNVLISTIGVRAGGGKPMGADFSGKTLMIRNDT